jgi:hypothetical protein
MKKTPAKRKLVLNAETIKKLAALPDEKLAQAAGGRHIHGTGGGTAQCSTAAGPTTCRA